jgi:hypothetical protein
MPYSIILLYLMPVATQWVNNEFGNLNGNIDEDVLINDSIFTPRQKQLANYIPLNIVVCRSCSYCHVIYSIFMAL